MPFHGSVQPGASKLPLGLTWPCPTSVWHPQNIGYDQRSNFDGLDGMDPDTFPKLACLQRRGVVNALCSISLSIMRVTAPVKSHHKDRLIRAADQSGRFGVLA